MGDDEPIDDAASIDANIIDVHKPTANAEDECTCCSIYCQDLELSFELDAILCPKVVLRSAAQLDRIWLLFANPSMNIDEWLEKNAEYRIERHCAVAWPPGVVAYRCHTCSESVTMALCADCFRNGDHTGHDYNMFKSRSGGVCDCGYSIMKKSGVCNRHGDNARALKADEPIPERIACVPRRMMPRLVHRLAIILRRSHVDLAGEPDMYLDFLSQMANSSAILRTLMIDAMISEEIYSSQLEFMSTHSDKAVARVVNEGIKKLKRERKGLSAFRLSQDWKWLKKTNAFCDNLEPRCFVDELVFWVVTFEFPQKLVCFLLGFLMDKRYKELFAKAFVNHYPRLLMLLAGIKGETRMRQLRDSFEQLSRRILQISVQIYNYEALTMTLCEKENTLHTLIYCLRIAIEGAVPEGLRGVLKFNPLRHIEDTPAKVVCCDNPIIRDRYLGSFAEDLNAVLDFKGAAKLLANDKDLLNTWIEMLSYFQTMSPYKRELTEHTPYETGPHVSVFTIEADFCLAPLWSILNRLKEEPLAALNLLESLHGNLIKWFRRMGFGPSTVLDYYFMSFHIPMHRMFAATLRHLIFIHNKSSSEISNFLYGNRSIFATKCNHTATKQAKSNSTNTSGQLDVMSENDFYKVLFLHPLQALTLYHETRSSMWTRNGLMTINQAVTYVHCTYCYSTVDLDMFLLRYCASRTDPNQFMKILMSRFHAWKWFSLKSNVLVGSSGSGASGSDVRRLYNHFNILPEQVILMVESSLVVLLQLLTLSLHCNISEREQTRQEMIALISVFDRSYSYLIEMLPDRNVTEHSVSDKNFVSLLAELTNYKPAQHGIGGDLRQGCYTLKGEVWDKDYDPMQVQHRFYQKRDYQMSLERFFQHSKLTGKLDRRFHASTLWPPLKIPDNIAVFGELDLGPLLGCANLLGMVYSILYKNLYYTEVPDSIMAYAIHLLEMALRKCANSHDDDNKVREKRPARNRSFTGRYCYSRLHSSPTLTNSAKADIRGSALYSTHSSGQEAMDMSFVISGSGNRKADVEMERAKAGEPLFPVVRHALDLAFDTTWFPFNSPLDNCLVFVENVYSLPAKEFEALLRCQEGQKSAESVDKASASAYKSHWPPQPEGRRVDGSENAEEDESNIEEEEELGDEALLREREEECEDDDSDQNEDEDDGDDNEDEVEDDDYYDDLDVDETDEEVVVDMEEVGRLSSAMSPAANPDNSHSVDLSPLDPLYLRELRRSNRWQARRAVAANSATQDRATNTGRSYWFELHDGEYPQVGSTTVSVTSEEAIRRQQQPPASTTSPNLTRTTYTNTTTQSRSMSRQVRSVFSLRPQEQMYWLDESAAPAANTELLVIGEPNAASEQSQARDGGRGLASASRPMSLVESSAVDSDNVEMISSSSASTANREPTGLAAIAAAAERLTYEVSQATGASPAAAVVPQQQTTIIATLASSEAPASATSNDHTYSAREVPMELDESGAAAAEGSLPPSQRSAGLGGSQLLVLHQQPPPRLHLHNQQQQHPQHPAAHQQQQIFPENLVVERRAILASDLRPMIAGSAQPLALELPSSQRRDQPQTSGLTQVQLSLVGAGAPDRQQQQQPHHHLQLQPQQQSQRPSEQATLSEMDIQARFMGFFQSRLEARPSARALRTRQTARRGGYRGPVAPFAVHNPNSVQVAPPPPPPTAAVPSTVALPVPAPPGAAQQDSPSSSSSGPRVNPTSSLENNPRASRQLRLDYVGPFRRKRSLQHQLELSQRTRRVRRKDRMHQGESVLSLLLRLHAKYSGKANSFQYNELRAKENLRPDRSRIGDGLHFVNIVLDLICNSDHMRARLEELQDLIWAKADKEVNQLKPAAKCDDIGLDIKTNSQPATPAADSAPEARQPGCSSTSSPLRGGARPLSPGERRRKAREFQQRLMADFASKQRAFIEKYEASSAPAADLRLDSDKIEDEEPINLSSKLDRRQLDRDKQRAAGQQQQQGAATSSEEQATGHQQQQLTRQPLDKRSASSSASSIDSPAASELQRRALERAGPTHSQPAAKTLATSTVTCECCICGLDAHSDLANPLGQVVLLQSSSIYGHSHLREQSERPLPCEESEHAYLKEQTYAKYLERRIDLLSEHFSQSSWLDSINIGAEGGVHVQSCGHYLHIECHQSYIKSLDQEDRLRARTDTDEFLCPVCRQLANSVLPILSNCAAGADRAAVVAAPDSQLDAQIARVGALLARRLPPNQKELHSSAAFCSHLTKATGPQYRLVRSTASMHSLFLFLTSIARTNLECELVVRHTTRSQTGSAAAATSNPALGSAKRSCFKLLFHVLALNAQTLINDQWFTCDHIWSHLTHRVNEKNRLSVKPLNSEVPLLLRDPTAMLLQFLFAITSPLCQEANFTCLVQILFNLAAVQSIALFLSYLPPAQLLEQGLRRGKAAPEEDEEPARAECGEEDNLRALVSAVAWNLAPLLRRGEEPLANPAVRSSWPFFGQQPQQDQWQLSLDAIQVACLPYLRAAALLQHHLYGRPYPEQRDQPRDSAAVRADFRALVTCLKLTSCPQSSSGTVEHPLFKSLHWPAGEAYSLLYNWSMELLRFGADFSIAARSLLLCRPLAWHRPALMRLPHSFDDVFMFYYRKKCSLCQQVPKDVAVCLVCGAPICFRVSCCKDRSRSRQVHSQHCGANTAVFLAVHTSSIVVIRGSRACVWGSVYLDAHDEEDNGLQRGKPLYLVQARFALLQEQWLTHSFDHTCGKRWIYLQENQ